MEFNSDKCEMMHLGKLTQDGTYTANDRNLRSRVERPHGANSSLKVVTQLDRVVKEMYGTLPFNGHMLGCHVTAIHDISKAVPRILSGTDLDTIP